MDMQPVTITPEMARELLERNTVSRPLSHAYINLLITEITDGKWRPDVGTIKIGGDGQVLDGLHRLHACALANIPIEVVVLVEVQTCSR